MISLPVDLTAPFSIAGRTLRNRVILAPMSGVTDMPFRQLAWQYGAGLVVTEMVASRELVQDRPESWSRLRNAGVRPHMVQLAGREPGWMAEAAKIAADHGADIIDINMGCPAKKVIGGYAGSALMRDPALALSLVEAVRKAVAVPVTVKMRLGWDAESINAPELARGAEEAGAAMITVHGRTRMQFYEGKADWAAIRAVRDRISVPLVANGDVDTPEDAAQILALSGADAVMIGRSCQGRPWHAGVLAGAQAPRREDIPQIATDHYRMMLDFYGEAVGLRHARKHLAWYMDRFAQRTSADLRAAILTGRDGREVAQRFFDALRAGLDEDEHRKAA